MLADRIEAKRINAFRRVFALCGMAEGEPVAFLSETQSQELNAHLTELALQAAGPRAFHVVMPTPPQGAVRSAGASDVLQDLPPAVAALAGSGLVADLTVEGLLHAPELHTILKGGARVLIISNENPDALERLAPDEGLKDRVRAALARCREATKMTVTSDAGSDLTID